MFEALKAATKTPLANSAIEDVTVEGETTKTDSMEVRSPSGGLHFEIVVC
jgi:hypothetical protein